MWVRRRDRRALREGAARSQTVRAVYVDEGEKVRNMSTDGHIKCMQGMEKKN